MFNSPDLEPLAVTLILLLRMTEFIPGLVLGSIQWVCLRLEVFHSFSFVAMAGINTLMHLDLGAGDFPGCQMEPNA